MNYKSYTDLTNDIKKNLHLFLEQDFDLIVGIPRSGMIPAYTIGLYLNLKVTDLNSLITDATLSSGSTRKSKYEFNKPSEAKKILIIDDSISSGNSLKLSLSTLKPEIRAKCTIVAIYSDCKRRNDIDFFLECVPMPRAFEWNIFHRPMLNRACLDIDGVLCIDPTEHENDDGPRYTKFLLNAKPLFIPSVHVNSLVTSRLEKYRPQTEEWLSKHGVKYSNLIMLDLPSKVERQRLGSHASHKSKYYIESNLDLFIESEPEQAVKIMEMSGKPVYCTDENIMFLPNTSYSIIKSPKTFRKKLKYIILSNLPKNFKDYIKPIYFKIIKRR
ncbi:phosphoribosyltransferase [Pseudoalteromonas nigrifaciens]|uniref:phosphoribosyltransferase family protein n=1 Tax=Pseudoalteromonas nigrifaciens TaxID=28109 RepID=UPI001787DAA1|nr:phosphoribosyltransferase family protein [Pseudoalteromonas nigrifaciens]MBE0421904.1 phosphoribosyltransferase [Pseudoalteromonas nigrifaciens]